MTTMILGGVSSFIFSQEAPTTEEQKVEKGATETKKIEPTEQAPTAAELAETPAPDQAPKPEKPDAEKPHVEPQQDNSEETAASHTEEPASEKATAPELKEPKTSARTKAQEHPSENPEPKPAEKTPTAKAEPENEINLLEIPSPIQEQEIIIPDEIIEEEPVGIDTVSQENPQGNWLFKRIWWERAEERYEKIRQLVDAIWEFRTKFFIERSKLDREVLDPFYISLGIDQGELEEILTEINASLEKSSQQENMSDDERLIYENYATQEEALKSLQNDVLTIGKLDKAVDDALRTLMDQINRVRQYETDAWKNFKEIAKILNDTKARELFFTIDGAAKNIKSISNYLENEFFTHFNRLISDAAQVVNRVQRQMDALKEKGIRFQRQTEIIEQQKQQAAAQDEEDEDEDDEDAQPAPKLGWFAWIGSLFSKTFNAVFSIIRMPYDMIFGK
jgi:hypothetical protein